MKYDKTTSSQSPHRYSRMKATLFAPNIKGYAVHCAADGLPMPTKIVLVEADDQGREPVPADVAPTEAG